MKFSTFTAGSVGRPDLEISILRLDLSTHRSIGNKYFKLADNLLHLKARRVRRVLSFGGAWSNHLLALAQSAQAAGIQTVGVVRGDEGFDNDMLARMRSHAMQVHFVSRAHYKLRHQHQYCNKLCRQLDCDAWLPEGGSNRLAVEGCEKIAGVINAHGVEFTHVVAAVGTGATLAGVIRGCDAQQIVTGIPVISDPQVFDRIQRWINNSDTTLLPVWSLYRGAKPVAYARPSQQQLEFILNFFKSIGVALDPVYTGPALATLLSDDFVKAVPPGARIAFVHSGGLAGAEGFRAQFERCCDQELAERYYAEIARLIR